jgi:hypothetical protein
MIDNVWVEELRPKKLDDIIALPGGNNHLVIKILKGYIEKKNIPHLLFSGAPGSAKTTSALCIAEEMYGSSKSHFIEINSSDDRGIDVVRNKIKEIAMKSSDKVIFLDECDALCLDENTEVLVGGKHQKTKKIMKIKDVPQDKYIQIPSLNLTSREIETDHGKCIDSGEQGFFKITLENGKEIIASENHPFFYLNDNKITEIKTKELTTDTKILDFQDDLNIRQCEICGQYTTRDRFCSMLCKDKGHSNDMSGEGNPIYGKEAWNRGKTKEDDIRIEKQCHYGDSNCSKRPEVSLKKSISLKKFYETTEGRQLADRLAKHLSETRKGKPFRVLFPKLTDEQFLERIKQSSSTYRENGVFKDTSYRKCLRGLTEVDYVHHKDGNHENNIKKNKEFNCPKCHNLESHDCMSNFLEKGWEILRGDYNARS